MEGKLSLKVFTKEKKIIDEEADAVFLPAITGEIGVLPGHIPLIAILDIGILNYLKDGKKYFVGILEGIAEVLNDNVNILADELILEENIIEKEEKEELEKAEEILKYASFEEQEMAKKRIKKALASLFLIKSSEKKF